MTDTTDAKHPVILWFRDDLRLADHRALAAAAHSGCPVICLFIFDDETPGGWRRGGASRWWLHHSLVDLSKAIAAAGNSLILRRGLALDVLEKVAAETNAQAIYCSRSYEPWSSKVERAAHESFAKRGITFKRFAGRLLREPEELWNKSGDAFKVYTPFWRALSSGFQPATPLDAPKKIPAPAKLPKSDDLSAWTLLPTKPDWAGGMREAWQPGEAGAKARLKEFLKDNLSGYADLRNRPDIDASSRLSPHLHFGEITPAMCWHAAVAHASAKGGADKGLEVFLKEICWREFSYYLLHHWPDLPEKPFRKEFAKFPWTKNKAALNAWHRGQTGYPIVDAGMRQLWTMGWMHNRVRMIVASFLIKDLLIPWQDGAAWFWDTLVDADLANNSASWQWVAGSGADAAPYFRIFNPMKQGETFDPEGNYVRRWVPELSRMPNEFIHNPSEAPALVLKEAGVEIGKTYPHPIVDHAEARTKALAAFDRIKTGASQ